MENENDANQPDEKSIGVLTDKVPIVVCSKCGCEIDVEDLDPFVRVECPDCGNIETVPAKLGPFRLLNLIGTGGMGGVYYAKDETLGRFVAIKVMLKSIGENKEFVESFKREAQSVARLNHPNIVQIYSFGQEKGQPYIVMELVSGQRFDKMVETKKALNQAFVMRVGLDIAEGLKAADEAGILHGDIKPENILLDEKLRAKLVDFGIATFANQGQADGIWGTPYYIAPEKVRRQKVDCRADIYGLGATLFHALSGRPPFEGNTPIDVVKARLNHPAQALHLLRQDIDPAVEKIIARMLEGDPGLRYPNYNSLIGDLRKAVQHLGAPGAVSGFSAEITRKSGRIFASKKHTSGSASGAPLDTPPPQPTRLVVHKKIFTTGGVYATESRTDKSKRPAGPVGPSKEELARREKRGARIFWTIILLLLVGGGVAIAVVVINKKKAREERAREEYALQGEKTKANNIYGQIFQATSNVVTLSNTALPMIDEVTNAVFVVSGEPLAPLQTVLPVELQPGTNAAMPVVAAPAPPPNEPEIATQARKVIASVDKLVATAKTACDLQAAALGTRNEIKAAVALVPAAAKVKLMEEALVTAQALEVEAKTSRDDAQKVRDEVVKKKMAKEKADADAIEAAKKEAAERARQEEERKKAEEHKQLVASELTLVEAARNTSLPMLKQHKYKDIVDTLTPQLATYQTDEGKAAFKLIIERYTRLQKLKAFAIERLNADPFRWGFDVPKVGTFDILGADDTHIKIKDKSVAWAEISVAQMRKILDNYLQGPGSQKLTIRVLGEQNLSTAIFCYENGGAKAASAYAAKAGELCADLQAEAKRLLPLE